MLTTLLYLPLQYIPIVEAVVRFPLWLIAHLVITIIHAFASLPFGVISLEHA